MKTNDCRQSYIYILNFSINSEAFASEVYSQILLIHNYNNSARWINALKVKRVAKNPHSKYTIINRENINTEKVKLILTYSNWKLTILSSTN